MKLDYTERFIKSLEDAPPQIRKSFYKQVRYLLEDLRHPSLRAKKYDESSNIWQARVTRDWRFYFRIVGDSYTSSILCLIQSNVSLKTLCRIIVFDNDPSID